MNDTRMPPVGEAPALQPETERRIERVAGLCHGFLFGAIIVGGIAATSIPDWWAGVAMGVVMLGGILWACLPEYFG